MKTIKEDMYNGHKIVIAAEYEEGTEKYQHIGNQFDTIKIALSVDGKLMHHHEVTELVEDNKDREKTYKKLINKVDEFHKKAISLINKKLREKEMTDGLPESLLVDEKCDQSEEEEDVSIYEAVYDVATQAIKDTDAKKATEIVNQFMKTLEKLNKELY